MRGSRDPARSPTTSQLETSSLLASNTSVKRKSCSSQALSQRNPQHLFPEQHGMRREHPQKKCTPKLCFQSGTYMFQDVAPGGCSTGREYLHCSPNARAAWECCFSARPLNPQTVRSSLSEPNASVARKCCSRPQAYELPVHPSPPGVQASCLRLLSSELMSGQLPSAITVLMLLTFITIHLVLFRFARLTLRIRVARHVRGSSRNWSCVLARTLLTS